MGAHNEKKKIRAVLLDRDGVVNREEGHILRIEDFEILHGVPEAIAELNKRGVKVALVSNQSGIARGLLNFEELEEIHVEMRKLLAAAGGHLDAEYIAPWHPDMNLPGGVEKWLGEHEDRKPGVGMLKKALGAFDVMPENAAMVGDSAKDRDAARLMGMPFFGVRSPKAEELSDESRLFDGLAEVLEFLIKQKRI